jgi:nitrate/nitrite-specific signal transduction histidine kinase
MIRNLSLGKRIGLGYGLIGLLVLLASSLGFVFTVSVSQTAAAAEQGIEQFATLAQLERSWSEVAATVDRMLLTRQTGGTIQQSLSVTSTTFDERLNDLANDQTLSNENRVTAQTLQRLGADLTGLVDEITAVSQDGRWARAQVIRHTEMSALQRRFDENLDQLQSAIQQEINASVATALQTQNTLRLIWLAVVVLAAIIGTVAGVRTVRSIVNPINDLITQTRRVTEQDFRTFTPLDTSDEIGELSRAFAVMTDLLSQSYNQLEARVADRTRALLASTEVSRRLTGILDQDTLIQEVLAELSTTFGYYHAQIYLFDERREYLALAGGTGNAGRQLLAQGHKLAQGQGLVGKAAALAMPVLATDVTQISEWLPNPLLPDTQAELAVPLLSGQQVIGVLDVQHNGRDRLQQEDVELLQSIANQLALALRNAALYAETEKRAERESLLRAINQQIASTTDVEMAMKVAVRELGQALGATQTAVRLLTPEEGPSKRNGRFHTDSLNPATDSESSQ